MQGHAIATGSATAVAAILVVTLLSSGFGVSLAQAMSQSLPVVLISAIVVALTTLLLRREIA